jgi:hypothetical protein
MMGANRGALSMKRLSRTVVLAMFAGLSAQSAHAASGDMQSSSTVTITVEIPPFAAGLAAQAEGAVGLWTMIDSQSTLMVKLPDAINDDEDIEAAVFTSASTPVSVGLLDSNAEVALRQASSSNGLVRHGFTLRREGVFAFTSGAQKTTATLVIAGV